MSIQKNAFYVSLILTSILWVILMVLFAFAPLFQEKELYRPIQILLESPEEIAAFEKPQKVEKPVPVVPLEDAPLKDVPKTEITSTEKPIQKPLEHTPSVKSTPSAAMKSSSVESVSSSQSKNASSSQKGVSQSKKKEPVQSASTSTSSTVEKSGEKSSHSVSEGVSAASEKTVTYKKSVDELLEEQFNSAERPQWDESLFVGDFVKEASSRENTNTVASSTGFSGAEALSGTAGTSSDGNNGAVAQVDKPSLPSEASRETLVRLNQIAEATYNAPVINGVVSSVSVNSATDSEGAVSIEMIDRSTRILLDPKKPYIILSEESASFIDNPRKVMIEFAVLPSGAVPFSRIDFIPSSLLPQAVQSEIREQISKWRFSTSSSEALARLEYNIKKR